MRFDTVNPPLSELAQRAAGKARVTLSCGCVFCDLDLKPTKLRRQWVHHLPKEGRNVVCEAKTLKPGS